MSQQEKDFDLRNEFFKTKHDVNELTKLVFESEELLLSKKRYIDSLKMKLLSIEKISKDQTEKGLSLEQSKVVGS